MLPCLRRARMREVDHVFEIDNLDGPQSHGLGEPRDHCAREIGFAQDQLDVQSGAAVPPHAREDAMGKTAVQGFAMRKKSSSQRR